jgi:hypothetical protein
VQRDLLELLEQQEPLDHKVQLEQQETRDQRVLLELLEPQVPLEQLEQLDLKA